MREIVLRLLILIFFFFMIIGHRQFPPTKKHTGCSRFWLSIVPASAILYLQPRGDVNGPQLAQHGFHLAWRVLTKT